jgi:hypothetical protein
MKNKNLIILACASFAVSVSAYADSGRVCFESDNPVLGGTKILADYRISFNKGEVASLVGQECVFITPEYEECLPGEGTLTAHNGRIEIGISGANAFPVPGGGEVFVLSNGYADMDPDTGVGIAKTSVTSFFNGSSSTQNYEGPVKLIACPSLTPNDKENIKTKDKFIKKATKMK